MQLFRTATNLHLVKVSNTRAFKILKYSCINLLWLYSSKNNYSNYSYILKYGYKLITLV